MWTNLFSLPSSFVQQAARGENFSRASMGPYTNIRVTQGKVAALTATLSRSTSI